MSSKTNRERGGRVKALRSDAGFTQEALAKMVRDRGVTMSRPTLANIEAGRQDMSSDQTVALADALSVSTNFILTGNSSCEKCNGSGACPTCNGSGVSQ